ncbi:MAG: SixA phosphatase family protein [Bradymonadia bacterium]
MHVYLIRHAIAEPRLPGASDAERALTYEGRVRFEQGVRGLACMEIAFDAVYHSPWRRAVQTAELLAPLHPEGARHTLDALAAPPGPALFEAIEGAHVALVGHEPWMSDLAAQLCLGPRALGGAFLFKKGGVAWLEGQPRPGGMVLRGFMPPKALRLMGDGQH